MIEIAKHQYADWRDLRHESMNSAIIDRMLSKLAVTFRDALKQRPTAVLPNVVAALPVPSRQDPPRAEPSAAAEPSQAASAAGATAKPELPKLVVNQLHRGDHTTIAGAIKAAKPGTLIAVEPGLYREGLVIDKPLEIVGQGTIGDVVIEIADANVILFQAIMGRIANVSLRQLGGNFFAVDITRGRLDLEDCDITSQGFACVAVHNDADPRLRRNRIHDGKRGGVYIYEQGRGTLEDNDIFANALSGVEIKTGGDPVLRRNRIHDGKQSGVFVNEQGRGTLEDNDIFANAYTGVEIKKGGDPILRRNRITQNGYEAIRVHQGGRGTFEANDLRGNARGAWDIADDCKDQVKRESNIE
jgi:F-box protein 11